MANLPILPDDDAAAIERAREVVISTRKENFPVLFEKPVSMIEALARGDTSILNRDQRPPKVMPATLRVEIRNYTLALFDAEAATIIKHAENESALRSWLNSVAARIQSEVTREVTNRSELDVHCPLHERMAAISTTLIERTEHWIKVSESDYDTTMRRGHAALARAKQVLDGVSEHQRVTERLNAELLGARTKAANSNPATQPSSQGEQRTLEPEADCPDSLTIGAQIRQLRDECRWTAEKLAEVIDRDVRTVQRHEAGEVRPQSSAVGAYERAFSKALKRQVVIKTMP